VRFLPHKLTPQRRDLLSSSPARMRGRNEVGATPAENFRKNFD
jgi:hypothetical protein